MIINKFTDLVNAPGRKAFILRWVGYKIRYFGAYIAVLGSNLIRKGRILKTFEIDLKAFLPIEDSDKDNCDK